MKDRDYWMYKVIKFSQSQGGIVHFITECAIVSDAWHGCIL